MEINRKWICWVFWGFHFLISLVYLGLSVTTATNINAIQNYIIGGSSTMVYKSGLMASVVLGFIIVFCFAVFSPIVMVGKHFGSDLRLSYGIMIGACFNSGWFMLLAGLVLNASNDLGADLQAKKLWNANQYNVFQSTFGFSYILCGSFLILTFVLFFSRNAMERESAYAADAPAAAAGGTAAASWPPSAPGGSATNPTQYPEMAPASSFHDPKGGQAAAGWGGAASANRGAW